MKKQSKIGKDYESITIQFIFPEELSERIWEKWQRENIGKGGFQPEENYIIVEGFTTLLEKVLQKAGFKITKVHDKIDVQKYILILE